MPSEWWVLVKIIAASALGAGGIWTLLFFREKKLQEAASAKKIESEATKAIAEAKEIDGRTSTGLVESMADGWTRLFRSYETRIAQVEQAHGECLEREETTQGLLATAQAQIVELRGRLDKVERLQRIRLEATKAGLLD